MSFNATLTGSPSFVGAAGGFGQAISLNGSSQYVTLASGALDVTSTSTTDYTWELRVKTSASGTQVALNHGSPLWIGTASGKPHVGFQAATGFADIEGASAINDGAWHTLALVLSASGTLFTFYVDGTSVGTSTSGVAWPDSTALVDYIGNFTFSGFKWTGQVDEVAFSNTARYSGTYAAPAAPFSNTRSSQLCLYHLDSGNVAGATLLDCNGASLAVSPSGGGAGQALTLTGTGTQWSTVNPAVSCSGSGNTVGATTVTSDTAATATLTAVGTAGAQTITDNSSGATVAFTATGGAFAAGTLSAGATTNTTVPLSWVAAANPVGSVTYQLQRAADVVGSPGSFSNVGSSTSGTGATDTGLSQDTLYWYRVVCTDSATPTPNTATSNAVNPRTANVFDPQSAAIVYSPYTWLVGSGSAKTINAGAYLRVLVNSTACTLNLSAGGATPYSQLVARLDGGSWQQITLTGSAQAAALVMPSATTAGTHLLEVVVKATTETANRWTTQLTAVEITGITLAAGGTLRAPRTYGRNVLVYGDSITEGVRALGSTQTNDTDRSDASVDYALALGRALGAEVGAVGFGGTGWTVAGSGSVPALTTSYALLWSGRARTFSPTPDLAIYLEGANEGSVLPATVQAGVQSVVAALQAAGISKHLVLCPLDGTRAAAIAAGVGSFNSASVVYVDTTGWITAATDTPDSLHPYGFAHLGLIAPRVAAAALSLLGAAPTPQPLSLRRRLLAP